MSFSSTTPPVGQIIVASSTKSASIWYLAASSTGSLGGTLMATSSGYVNNTIANVVTSTSTQYTVAFDTNNGYAQYATSSFLYNLKVSVNDRLGNAVIPYSASYNGVAMTSSIGRILYWAVPGMSNTTGIFNIIADGYLYATTTNPGFSSVTVGSTTQVFINLGDYSPAIIPVSVSTTTKGLQTTLKLTSFNDELGNSIMPTIGSPFTATAPLVIVSQHYNSTDGAWYVAATSTNFAAGTLTPGTLTASVNGYVSESTTTVVTSTTTQQTINVDNSAGGIAELPFALKRGV